ncbi:sugar-binding transcriptional regulator [Treponema sp.]
MASRQREELAARVTLLYYEYQKNQNEIANELGISRSYVSQLLTFAKESGMVKITINIDSGYVKEAEFNKQFPNLKHTYIMQSESEEYTTFNIGPFAAPHVSRLINSASAIGINLGRAVQSVIDCLDESDFKSNSNKTVAQLMGGFSDGQSDAMMPGELVTRISKKIGSNCLYLNYPVIIDNTELKSDLMKEKSLASIASFWKTLDLAIMGIGVVDDRSRIFSRLPKELKKELLEENVCSELTVNYFNENGLYKPVLINNKISIPYEDLLKINNKVVIGHGYYKAKAILAGLRSGMINYLFTDSITVDEIERLMSI